MHVLSVLVGGGQRTGGPPAFVGEAALELPALGARMTVVTTDLALAPTGWWQRQRRIGENELHPALARAELTVLPARFPRRFAFSPELRRNLEELLPSCDVVHIHNLWQYPQYAAYRAAMKRGAPYIVSPHGSLDPYLRSHGQLRKRLSTVIWQKEMLEKASLLHVTTKAEGDLTADIAPHVPRRIVPCAVHTDEFAELPAREQFRESQLAGYAGPVILFLSRLTQKKGVDVLLRAFAHVRRELESRLVIAGPDDEGLRPSLQRLADGLGVGRDVYFAGPVFGNDRLAALAAADVWALSSHTENFGIAVVEAMAAGCPVVITPAVNISADVAAAGAGVVAEASAERFGQELLKLLSDERRREDLRVHARSFARRYDWRVVAPQLVEMYRETARAGS